MDRKKKKKTNRRHHKNRYRKVFEVEGWCIWINKEHADEIYSVWNLNLSPEQTQQDTGWLNE